MATAEQVSVSKRSSGVRATPTTEGTRSTAADGPADLLALQSSAGNRAVSALVQAKLEVGAVDDPLEREADRVASSVVAGLRGHGAEPRASAVAPVISRRAMPDGGAAAGGELDAETDATVRRASGGGRSLDPEVRRSMESGFGADFSGVRVHQDAQADGLNRQLGARAFTTGSDIFFRQGEYAPATTTGQELLAHELTHVVQQGGAPAATGDGVHRSADPQAIQRKAYRIGSTGEKLEIDRTTSEADRTALLAEAEQIMDELATSYGVVVSSSTTVKAIKQNYTHVLAWVRASLSKQPWRIGELRALRRALGYYSAILGANRATSNRKDAPQEVTSVGKVKNAINHDSWTGKLDSTTLGEYFESKKNMGLFKSSERYASDFSTVADQLTGTFVHEIAHGLLAYAIPDFIAATDYWKDEDEELPKPLRMEDPVTSYGKTNAAEDICESAMMFFVAPARLQASCPLRYAFMQQLGTDWIPAPTEAPQVQPDAPGEAPQVATGNDTVVPPELEQAQAQVEKILQKVDNAAPSGDREEDEAPSATPWQASQPGSSRGGPLLGANRSRG
jgi:hypothetical protein